jgi:hypothetical protein
MHWQDSPEEFTAQFKGKSIAFRFALAAPQINLQ